MDTKTTLTLDEVNRAAMDPALGRKVMAIVNERRKSDPKFSPDDLRAELRAAQQKPAELSALAEDFDRSWNDNAAGARVMAEVRRRQATDRTFTLEALRKEVSAWRRENEPAAGPAPVVAFNPDGPLTLGDLTASDRGNAAAARKVKAEMTRRGIALADLRTALQAEANAPRPKAATPAPTVRPPAAPSTSVAPRAVTSPSRPAPAAVAPLAPVVPMATATTPKVTPEVQRAIRAIDALLEIRGDATTEQREAYKLVIRSDWQRTGSLERSIQNIAPSLVYAFHDAQREEFTPDSVARLNTVGAALKAALLAGASDGGWAA